MSIDVSLGTFVPFDFDVLSLYLTNCYVICDAEVDHSTQRSQQIVYF